MHSDKHPIHCSEDNSRNSPPGTCRAVFERICHEAGVPVQHFANRSDAVGGSTLGNLSNTQVSVHAVDIGLPQPAMHSAYETAGVHDTAFAIRALTAYYNADLAIEGADEVRIG